MIGAMTLVVPIATKLFSDSEMLRLRFEASPQRLRTPTFFHLGLILVVYIAYGLFLTSNLEPVVSKPT